MKFLFSVFLLCTFVCSNAQDKDPYLLLKYDSLVMYQYTPYYDSTYIIDKKGVLSPYVKDRAKLDDTTAGALNKWLADTASYNNEMAWCFDPHLAFVYYKDGKPVADIVVCLGCNTLISSLHIPPGSGKGMSDKFREYLQDLENKHAFKPILYSMPARIDTKPFIIKKYNKHK